MTHTTRTVISKSAKRKMTSTIDVYVEQEDGKFKPSKETRQKANTHTVQVIYKTALGNGKFHSQTKHEVRH